jgi:endonuclease G
MRKRDGLVAAAAYVLSQAELLKALPEEFVFGEYKAFQLRVSGLEARTGLRFGELPEHDTFARTREVGAAEELELERHDQMVV